MYGNKSIKKRKDGSNYKDFYYYGCKHRNMTRGHKCDYKKQVHEEMLDASVAEVISKLVSNPKFSDLIRNKINMEVDNYKIQLRKLYHNKDTILSDMDSLDYEDKHYQRRKTDLENHLYKTYDKIDDAEELLVSAKAKKRSLLADKITGDNIYKALVFFDKLYAQMNEGYVAKDYYLEFSEDLGKPIKIEEDTTVESDTFEGLADGIREIERLINSLVQRERDLAILEERLKKENDELKRRFSNEKNEKNKAINEREKAKEQLQAEIETTYSFVKKIISGSFCRQLEYIDNIGINRWLDIDEFYHELGKKQGYDEDIINDSVFEFIEIYAYFGRYRASYRYMVSMAKENDTWVYINESTFKWACKQNLGWQVIDAMENSLKNNKIRYEHIKDYEEKISKLKKIRGF